MAESPTILKASPKCYLEPISLHSQAEFDELLRQRKACGWNDQPSDVDAWRDMIDNGTKIMFWIVPPALADQGCASRRVGHISLQSASDPPDPELAREDKTLMMISTFFIYPAHRGGGLGRAAVGALEAMARTPPYGSPDCRAITLHTTDRRYTEIDTPQWRGAWAEYGLQPKEKGSTTEDWYVRMGYVKWKDEPLYRAVKLDGTETRIIASFLRKKLA